MSAAQPLSDMDRAETYWGQRGTYMTPRQRRRFTHKQHADVGRRLAELVAGDPELTLCGCHVREYCIGCLMCLRCDGCECMTFDHLSPGRFE